MAAHVPIPTPVLKHTEHGQLRHGMSCMEAPSADLMLTSTQATSVLSQKKSLPDQNGHLSGKTKYVNLAPSLASGFVIVTPRAARSLDGSKGFLSITSSTGITEQRRQITTAHA